MVLHKMLSVSHNDAPSFDKSFMTVEFDGLEQDCCVGSTISMMLRYKYKCYFKFDQFKKLSKIIQDKHNSIYENNHPVESQYGFDIVPVDLMTEFKFKLDHSK